MDAFKNFLHEEATRCTFATCIAGVHCDLTQDQKHFASHRKEHVSLLHVPEDTCCIPYPLHSPSLYPLHSPKQNAKFICKLALITASIRTTCDGDFFSWPSSINKIMQQHHFLMPGQTPGRHCTRALLHCYLLVVAVNSVRNIELQDKRFGEGGMCGGACGPVRILSCLSQQFNSKPGLAELLDQEFADRLNIATKS